MKDFRNIIFVLVIATFILQMYVLKEDAKAEVKSQKPTISLSTFALYDIAKNISQDTFELVMILPFGVDAHSFEPTPKLMTKIMGSDLVVYSGSNESVFGAKGPNSFLAKATFIIGFLFVSNTIALGYLYSSSVQTSVVDNMVESTNVVAPTATTPIAAPAKDETPAVK
jgi:protein translocase SecG subunit